MYDIYITVYLEVGLSTRGPVFSSKAVYVGFVVDYVLSRQDTISVSPVSIIPQMLHAHFSFIYHRRHLILSNDSAVTNNIISLAVLFPLYCIS